MTDPKDNRLASVRVRLTDDEKRELEEQAWRARKTVSAYVRDSLSLTRELEKAEGKQ